MPSAYLYALVALAVVLVVVGVFLGMEVVGLRGELSALAGKYSALEGEYSGLLANYTALKESYSGLLSNYSGIRANYSRLMESYMSLNRSFTALGINYTILKGHYAMLNQSYISLLTNYTRLSQSYINLNSSFIALNQSYMGLLANYTRLSQLYSMLQGNYTSLIQQLTEYEAWFKPIIYIWSSKDAYAVWLNITNPTNKAINITIYQADFPQLAFSMGSTTVMVPPKSTLPLFIRLELYNSTFGYSEAITGRGYWYGSFNATPPPLVFMDLIMPNSKLNAYGVWGLLYNYSADEVVVNNLADLGWFGYAYYSYYYSSPSVGTLVLVNPSNSSVVINGYSLYSYNGTLLDTCTLSPPFTINATEYVSISGLPTETSTFTSGTNGEYVSALSLKNGAMTSLEVSFSVSCIGTYSFPTSKSQLPYGYILLYTNIGVLKLIMLPSPW